MINLGNFVGGAVQSYRQGQDFDLRQQEATDNRNFRERQLKIQEADEAEKQATREREKALRVGSTDLFQKYYGDKTEQVGETEADDGQGGVTKVPTLKTTSLKPGQDPATDAKWYSDHLLLVAKHSGMTADDMAKTAAQVDTLRRTEQGQLLDKVTTGDKDALSKLLKMVGKDPAGAKLDFRPLEGVNEVVLADGTKLDLKKYAAANATAAHYAAMRQSEADAQGTASHAATVRNLGASTDLHAAQAGEIKETAGAKRGLLGAQTRAADASAADSYAGAGLKKAKAANVGASTAGLQEEKINKEISAEASKATGVDPTSTDGKGKNVDQYSYVAGRASKLKQESGGKLSTPQAVQAAKAEWDTQADRVNAFVDSETKGLDSKAIKAKFGTSDKALIKSVILRKKLGVTAAPAAPARRAAAVTDDENE